MSPTLRSHKLVPSQPQLPPPSKSRKPKTQSPPISPHTPSKTRETMSGSSSARRSSRLASKSSDDGGIIGGEGNVGEIEVRVCDPVGKDDGKEAALVEESRKKRKFIGELSQILNLRSGKRVLKTGHGIDESKGVGFEYNGLGAKAISGSISNKEEKGKGVAIHIGDGYGEKGLNLKGQGRTVVRSGSKDNKGKTVILVSDDPHGVSMSNGVGLERRRTSFSREEKGKGLMVDLNVVDLDFEDEEDEDEVDGGHEYGDYRTDNYLDRVDNSDNRFDYLDRTDIFENRIENDLVMADSFANEIENYLDRADNFENGIENDLDRVDNFENGIENNFDRVDNLENIQNADNRVDDVINGRRQRNREAFHAHARRNATRFAHFSLEQEEGNGGGGPNREGGGEVFEEDWPGPFSTALKILRDRMSKEQTTFAGVSIPEKLLWVPGKDCLRSRPVPPSLEQLSMAVLAKNIDAVSSLDSVPDVLRHKLTQLLCDSRRMNGVIFGHLLRGSPTEVCVRDCSWLTDEQFTELFKECETSHLTVLQLDQCGRCMPDYVLNTTLARSCNSMPVLTTLSLKGGCRLSDIGLKELVSSTPNLRSLNLGQCSLLTFKGIEAVVDSLGSVLKELYLDDCQGIETKLALPALKKLKSLEVFSLAGFESLNDDFIEELMVALGHNMKEILLTDCVELTDSSLKAIARSCPGLCALDLVNLHKLTDSGIGYLGSGSLEIQTLKLCRNEFSDEAVAAFLETSGESLLELSLNNISKVARNTALSISKRARKLVSLDLSWCRKMSDDALGLIVDSCPSLKMLKLFGCTQVTNTFLDGHSNAELEIIGIKMTPILKLLKEPDLLQGPLRYSSV